MYFVRTIEKGMIKLLLPSGVKQFPFKAHTDDRKRASREADQFERLYLDDLSKRIGRQPTQTEILDGKVASATDSRTFAEKYNDANFNIAKTGELSQLERMLEATEGELERERYKKLSPTEQRREDIARMLARQEVEEESKSGHQERLAKHAETIEQLKARQHALNWSPDADEKDRELIRKALAILNTENSDLRSLQPLLKQIDDRAEERRQNELTKLTQQSDALATQLVTINEQQSNLAEGVNNVSNE